MTAPRTLTLLALQALALAACPTRGPLNLGGGEDGGFVDPSGDGDLPDAPPLGPPCPAPAAPRRTDPCPTRGDCGLPSAARVNITGARTVLREFQVRVVLPAAIRAAAGPACDRLSFRTPANQWVPHFVTNCAMGEVWIRVPEVQPAGTVVALNYGGPTPVPAAQSYDDTFDRVPTAAAGLIGAWSFDEGTGTRSCPAAGGVAFDAYIHDNPFARGLGEVRRRPELWSREAPPSMLAPDNAAARFSRGQFSLNFERSDTIPDPRQPAVTRVDRLVNWRSDSNLTFRAANDQLTVGVWVYTETPANEFEDNFQTVICYGMPAHPRPPFQGAVLDGISIFNPWALFFRSDDANNTFLQGNTCVFPCINIDQYAHITTKRPFTREAFTRRWHFAAMTVDTTSRPHATRRSYFDGDAYEFPRDLNLFPEDTYCPGPPDARVCRYPPDTAIYYYDAPVVLGADLNAGEARLNLEGKIDDLFIIGRAAPPEEIRAYRERRKYSPDPVVATVAM